MDGLFVAWVIGSLALFVAVLMYFLGRLPKNTGGKSSVLGKLSAVLISALITVLVAGGGCAIFLGVVLSGPH